MFTKQIQPVPSNLFFSALILSVNIDVYVKYIYGIKNVAVSI